MSLVVPAAAPSSPLGRPPASRPLRDGVVEIGGYRLVRRLGEGSAAVSWLARGGDESVVLRVYRDLVDDDAIDREIAARERLAGPHVPALLDLATGRDGRPVPILTAVTGPLLDDVLAGCAEPLRAGHATTILAPIAALVDAAHEVGATLGRIDARSIRIDSDGTPVLVSLGRAAAAAPLPPRFRDREPAIVHDRSQLDLLCSAIIALVDARERPAVRAAVDRAAGAPAALELALFDAAAPLPLLSAVAADPATDSARAYRAAAVVGRGGDEGATPEGSSRLRPGRLRRLAEALGGPADLVGLPEELVGSVRGAIDRVLRALELSSRSHAARARARSRLERPRRAVVAAGIAGALALATAIAVTALEGEQASTAAAPSSELVRPSVGPGAGDAASVPSRAPEPPAASAPERIVDPSPQQWGTVVGELVDRWLSCAGDGEERCGAEVVQPDSVAAALLGSVDVADRAGALGSWAVGERDVVLVDRLGAAAVVDLLEDDAPVASLLVMRGEAGWRIRAVLS